MRRRSLLSLSAALALVAVAVAVAVAVRVGLGAGSRITAGVSAFSGHPPVHHGGVVPGKKTLPPEPTTPAGVPVLLAGGPARDAYLQQMADRLDVSTAPPPRLVGFFGRVQKASAGVLTLAPERPSAVSPNAITATVSATLGADGAPVRVTLTPQTVLWLSARPAQLRTGTELFAGGERSGKGLQAQLVSDLDHMRRPPASSPGPAGNTRGTALPGLRPPANGPGTEGIGWQAGGQVVPAAAVAPVALTMGSPSAAGGDPANGTDTVILSDRAGLGGLDPHFKAEVGDESSCYARVEAEFLLAADYEIHWPFQIHPDGDGFTVEAQDRTPEAGGGFSFEATATGGFDQYSVYSGWGLALGADITIGCHVSFGPFAGDLNWSVSVGKPTFAWVNKTKRHIPLSGQVDLVVPPDKCPLVGISAGPLTLGIGDCQWQTYSGGLFRATVQGAGGTPQGIAMPYAGHDAVQPQTAPSGGPVDFSQFNYAAIETTRMSAGVVADFNLRKVKKPQGGKQNQEDTEPETVSGAYRSAQRHPDQVGPTTPSGVWQDRNHDWHASDGTPADPPSSTDIEAGNANWVHPGQVGPTLADGVWQHRDGRWRTPDGRFTTKPADQAANPATEQGDKEEEPQGLLPDSTSDIHGWDYQDTAGAPFHPTGAVPDTLPLDLPVAPQTSSAPPSPSPSGQATVLTTYNPWQANAAGLEQPAPGLSISQASGSCDSGSADDPGRAAAWRCTGGSVGNGTPCFAMTGSGDPGSPLLCVADPSSNEAVLLDQGGGQLPLDMANRDDPSEPPWVLVLADGRTCHFLGYGTNSAAAPYDCGAGWSATLPDRSTPSWTVREGVGPAASGPPIGVRTAYR